MFVRNFDQAKALIAHRDLLKRKLVELKLESKNFKHVDNRQLVYGLREQRQLKQNQLNSLLGMMKSKINQTSALKSELKTLQQVKSKVFDETKVLMENKGNNRKQISLRMAEEESIKRENQALTQKRNGVALSNAELQITLERVLEYIQKLKRNSSKIREDLKILEDDNNRMQFQIDSIYSDEEKNVSYYSKIKQEIAKFKSKYTQDRLKIREVKIERESVSYLVRTEQEKQLKFNNQIDSAAKKRADIDQNHNSHLKQNSRLKESRDQLLKQKAIHMKAVNDVGNHIQNLKNVNMIYRQTLSRSMNDNRTTLDFQRDQPLKKQASFASTKSSLRF